MYTDEPAPPERQWIDERWLKEYADWGVSELTRVLGNHSRFLDWLDQQHEDDE